MEYKINYIFGLINKMFVGVNKSNNGGRRKDIERHHFGVRSTSFGETELPVLPGRNLHIADRSVFNSVKPHRGIFDTQIQEDANPT